VFKRKNKDGTEGGANTTMVKNYVAHASEEMVGRYASLIEKYARKALDFRNGSCEINFEDRNKMETIGKKRNKFENSTLASARVFKKIWSGRGDLNSRPLGPEPSALPGCATPRMSNGS
jgi:hypothetical protein